MSGIGWRGRLNKMECELIPVEEETAGDRLRRNLRNQYWRLNNLYWVQDKNNKTVKYRFSELQLRLWKESSGWDIVLKARQQKISTYFVILFLDACLFNDNMNCVTIADCDENMYKLLSKAKFAYEHLPVFIKKLYPLQYSNRDELVFKRRNSRYSITLENRSNTVTMMHFSEVAFMKKDKERIAESMESVPLNNPNVRVVFESIANGVGNEFHTRYFEGKNGESKFKSHFFRWFDDPEYQLKFKAGNAKREFEESLSAEERVAMGVYSLTLEQMQWRRAKIMGMSGTLEEKRTMFLIKYPENDEDCFASTGNLLFDQTLVGAYMSDKTMQLDPFVKYSVGLSGRFSITPDGYLDVYEEPVDGEEYVISGDVSKGINKGDYSVLYVFNKRLYKPVAHMRIHCAPEVFGLYCVYVGLRYNTALIAIEKNDRGHVAIQKCVNMRYVNLYYDGMERGAKLTEFGFTTTEKSKKSILEQFVIDFKMGSFQKLPYGLIDELRSYIQKENGSYSAIPGKHDDEIMSFSLGLYMCYLFPYYYKTREHQLQADSYQQNLLDRESGTIEMMQDMNVIPMQEFTPRIKKTVNNMFARGGKVNVIF